MVVLAYQFETTYVALGFRKRARALFRYCGLNVNWGSPAQIMMFAYFYLLCDNINMSRRLDVVPGQVLTATQALDTAHPFSTIVVIPYTSRLELGNGNTLQTSLSLPSEIALRGAVEVHKQHQNSQLVIPGETSYEGYDSTTDLMLAEAVNELGVAEERLVPLGKTHGDKGRTLDNTYLQARAVAESFATHNALSQGETLVVPFAPHLARVMRAMKGYGIQARYVTVESVLAEARVSDYDEYMPCMADLARERMKMLLGGDKGRFLNLLSYVTGPGYLDIVHAEPGDTGEHNGYKLYESSARTQLKNVRRSIASAVPSAL
jgi:hypothetical protein